jgi:membrane fusion protein, multidrug efflux system
MTLRVPFSRTFPLVLCVLTTSVAGCRDRQPVSAAGAPNVREVQVVPVREAILSRTIAVDGALAAAEQAVVSMKVAGRVSSLPVDLGSEVVKGQVLAQVEPRDYELRVAQAEAMFRQARARLGLPPDGDSDAVDITKSALVRQAQAVVDESKLTLDRIRQFVDRGISPRSELDSADASYKVADGKLQDAIEEVRNRQAVLAQRRSELELAREQQVYTSLRAPFSGRISERTASLGQYVAAGTPVVTIVRIDTLRLRLEVPEREATRVRINQPVNVTVEGDETTYTGRLARVSPAISPEARTLLVEAEIRNEPPRLRPGSFCRAQIIVEASTKALMIPSTAVVTFAGVDKVFVVTKDRAVEKRVQLGRREGPAIEIVQGLQAGEPVIDKPGPLVAGDRVTAAKAH